MPHPQPRVSVIVPTYNRSQFLAECLDSLLSQTLPSWQVLVVDDGCTDGTSALLEAYRDPVEVLRTEAQSGKGAAVNLALARVTGDYVWVFDDDDVALPDALERFVEPLERSRALHYSFSPWLCADSGPDGRIGAPTWESPVPDLATRGALACLLERNYLGGAALFVRRSCVDELGGYDPSLVRSQDYEFAIRVVRRYAGARVRGGSTFLYRQHPGARGSSADRFGASQQFAKWLEYDRIIMRRLRRDLRPGELLPPGRDPAAAARLEQLACFAMMASRLLVPESVRELHLLAERHHDGPLDAQERRTIRETAIRDPWYGVGSVYDDAEFVGQFVALAARSPLLRAVRREVLLGLRQYITMEGVARIPARLPVALRRAQALTDSEIVAELRDVPTTPLPEPRA